MQSTKAAVHSLARGLFGRVGRKEYKVNVLSPGPMENPGYWQERKKSEGRSRQA